MRHKYFPPVFHPQSFSMQVGCRPLWKSQLLSYHVTALGFKKLVIGSVFSVQLTVQMLFWNPRCCPFHVPEGSLLLTERCTKTEHEAWNVGLTALCKCVYIGIGPNSSYYWNDKVSRTNCIRKAQLFANCSWWTHMNCSYCVAYLLTPWHTFTGDRGWKRNRATWRTAYNWREGRLHVGNNHTHLPGHVRNFCDQKFLKQS
jgi:hypothetical protein